MVNKLLKSIWQYSKEKAKYTMDYYPKEIKIHPNDYMELCNDKDVLNYLHFHNDLENGLRKTFKGINLLITDEIEGFEII